VAIPHPFFKRVVRADVGVRLPPADEYAIGMFFLPTDVKLYNTTKEVVQHTAESLGYKLLAWRPVPTDNSDLGESALKVEPKVEQAFFAADEHPSFGHLEMETQVTPSPPCLR
jgi:glutamate synthase (NADH)